MVRRPLRQDHRAGRQRSQHDEHAGHPVDPLVRRDPLRQEGRQAEGQHQGDVRHGSRRQHRDAYAAGAEGHRGARAAGGGRSASDDLGGAGAGPQERHLSPADRHQLRDRGLAHLVQPRDPMGRADRQADLRVQGRQRGDVSPRQEARLRRPDVQEHQGREQRADRRGHPARDQPRRLVDRLLRPVAGAAEVAHGEPKRLRHADAEGHDRPEQGRLLRPAMAVLGHAGVQAPGHAAALQHQPVGQGGGGTFRARFGVEREETLPDGSKRKVSLLGNGYYSKDSEIKDGYPEFTLACSRSSVGTRT